MSLPQKNNQSRHPFVSTPGMATVLHYSHSEATWWGSSRAEESRQENKQ